jgi:hypothetical protein
LAIYDKKHNSTKDGIDEINSLFRWNSGCSALEKNLGSPFQTIPLKRKCLKFHTVEQKANFRILFEAFYGEKTFVFESLSQNAAAESFKNSVRKDNF